MDWKKIFGIGKKRENQTLSDELAKEMGFSDDVINIVKQISNNYQRLIIRNLFDDGKKAVDGISFLSSEEQAEKLVIELQAQLNSLEYLVFISERDFRFSKNSKCKIALIKGNNQFEILKFQQTNGENYDVTNENVIAKLIEWDGRYPFTIIGADYDWVEANFKVLPDDKEIISFAQELYDFCPDIVEQGAGSIEELIDELKNTKKLYLWWD